ncbi:MAG: hypothetical protein KGM91_12060 [Burkholderiales bacterium]|nr:hypothetical protein [Burkholderiales bacterium]
MLRKLSQNVALFHKVLDRAAADTGLSRDDIASKMVGRQKSGDPLAAPGRGNDFNYNFDLEGSRCPLHAHIRRSNPRLSVGAERPIPVQGRPQPPLPPGARVPRIMRRGMSFGARYDESSDPADPDDPRNSLPVRGLYFMAYNARIGEQFEVIQRWLAGGNSTGGYSARSDPLVGIAAAGERRSFVFEAPVTTGVSKAHCVLLDGDDDPSRLANPLVRLEWGAYLFTPSLAALKNFEKRAAEASRPKASQAWPWSADQGRAAIERLLALDAPEAERIAAWKSVVEDPEAQKDFSAASIWAAIRRDYGGVLRTPYGVLAASHAHAQAVLSDSRGCYTVNGYRERSLPSLGDIYLGLDDQGPGCPYHQRSAAPNKAIRTLIAKEEARAAARELTRRSIARMVATEKDNAFDAGDPVWRLKFGADEVWDEVLEGLCQQWFGLPADGPLIKAGSFSWDWKPEDPVLYPGHFLAPSRYIFQPRPGAEVSKLGARHGKAVNTAFRNWVTSLRDQGKLPTDPEGRTAPLSKAFFEAFPRPADGNAAACQSQDELVAVVLLGALIGFLPTVVGNLRASLNEWLLDGSFWSMRAGSLVPAARAPDSCDPVESALLRSMMLRPSPEVVWRRANSDHELGPLKLCPGETVVVSIVSAMHELLELDRVDVGMVFGGWSNALAPGISIPIHACPGREVALGVLLGVLSGLLECEGALRPTAFALVFGMEGDMPPAPTALEAPMASGDRLQDLKELRSLQGHAIKLPVDLLATIHAPMMGGAAGGLSLLAGGDSWFDYGDSDLAAQLSKRANLVVTDQAAFGTKLAEFAGVDWSPGQDDKSGVGLLCDMYIQLAALGTAPDAILISAGGNDVVGDLLRTYIVDISKRQLSPDQIKQWIAEDREINDTALKTLMDGPDGAIRTQIVRILNKVKQRCRRADGSPAIVVWQGYDYPIPDGRIPFWPFEHNGKSRLWKPLSDLGYADLADEVAIMKRIGDRFNALLAEYAAGAYNGQLIHANLRGTLDGTLAGVAYKADWANEMHPSPPGFAKLADSLYNQYLQPLIRQPLAS